MRRILIKLLSLFDLEIQRKTDVGIKHLSREDFFRLYFSTRDNDNFFLLQIGTNDGRYGDPIFEFIDQYKLHGVLVEPLPDIYNQLQKTHQTNKNVKLVNAGISKVPMPFYSINPAIQSHINNEDYLRLTGIASFDKALFLRRLQQVLPKIFKKKLIDSDIEKYVAEIPIQVMSMSELIDREKISRVDLLFTDCQGKDYELLMDFDFERFSPSLINIEIVHLSAGQIEECERLLQSKGYNYFSYGNDLCAYKL